MAKSRFGFIALQSLKQGPPDPEGALAEIRRIYFATTRQTIDHDLAHAIELLKSLPTDELREKARVFMHGLNDMQREWQRGERKRTGKRTDTLKSGRSGRSGKVEK